MSIRSEILRENLDGSFDGVYCHWDGYPSHNGAILLKHYQDPAKIQQILDLGDISSLAPEIGEKHNFDKRIDGQCTFYGRDRDETGVEAKHFDNAEQLAKHLEDAWTEWVYVFRMADQKWYYTNNPSPTWFKLCGSVQRETELLTEAACAEQ